MIKILPYSFWFLIHFQDKKKLMERLPTFIFSQKSIRYQNIFLVELFKINIELKVTASLVHAFN